MSLLPSVLKHALLLSLATTLLVSCKDDPATAPTTPVTPVTPGTTPTQYGTPFTEVPNREDAVIYQVNMRAFSQSANFAGVTARLDSIKALGVNVLYLMPIYPVGALKSFNSPYCVRDYTAVNAEFGSLDDLRTLVNKAHEKHMSVMLDWVPNHTSWDHAWITAHRDWYAQDAAGNILSPTNNGNTYTDVAQLNYSNSAMRLAMIAALKSWVYTANVDGFRFDYADYQPADFWKQAIDTLRNIRTHKLLLLNEGGRSANFTAGFDYNFGFGFYDALKGVYGSNRAATSLDAANTNGYVGATGTQHVVHYTTNHDVNGSDGTPWTLFGRSHDGAMSAFVIAACYEGVPMIYNGQEAGMTTPITFPFTSVKVVWDRQPAITQAYKQLLRARAGSVALRHGVPATYSSTNVCAFTKTEGGKQALVLVNVRSTASQYPIPSILNNTTWTNLLQSGTVTLSGQVTLPPYGYMVLEK